MEDHKEGAQNLERGLKPRHVEMIALGGTIGVGLFMGSANTIQMAGRRSSSVTPLLGVVMFFIMRIMGEMLYQEPVTGSFATYGHKYIRPLYRLPYGLFLLVLVGRRRPFGSHSRRHLRPLLVPLAASMDIGPGRDGRRRHCQHGSRQVLRGI